MPKAAPGTLNPDRTIRQAQFSGQRDVAGMKLDIAAPLSELATVLGAAWPIGSVFISTVPTDPATLLGVGTWAAFGAGRVLVGIDPGDPDFDTAEETGGAKTVAAAGSVSAVTVAAHTTGDVQAGTGATVVTDGSHSVSGGAFTGSATSVVQPYITAYFWKRTA